MKITLEDAEKICEELSCKDCPCSDYGNLGSLKLIKSICWKDLMENHDLEDFKEILE